MRPLLLSLLLALASLGCLGNKNKVRHHAEHHREHTTGVYHPHRYPVYMMQLYRDYRAVELRSRAASEQRDALLQTDSVLSLMAKGKAIFFPQLLILAM